MSRVYMVEMRVVVAVVAENNEHALKQATMSLMREVASDMMSTQSTSPTILREVKSEGDLRMYGWSPMDIPYSDAYRDTIISRIVAL